MVSDPGFNHSHVHPSGLEHTAGITQAEPPVSPPRGAGLALARLARKPIVHGGASRLPVLKGMVPALEIKQF